MIKAVAAVAFTAGAAAGTFIGTGLGKALARKPKELIKAYEENIDNLKEEVHFWRSKHEVAPTDNNLPDEDTPFESIG